MTRNELLKQIYDRECNNLLCYSKNYLMDTPKDGCEKEWQESSEKTDLLQQMIDEIPHSTYDREKDDIVFEKVLIGDISELRINNTHTMEPHRYIEKVTLTVKDIGNEFLDRDDRILEIDHDLGIKWFVDNKYDIERHERYALQKSTTFKATVRGTTIVDLDWLEEPELSLNISQKRTEHALSQEGMQFSPAPSAQQEAYHQKAEILDSESKQSIPEIWDEYNQLLHVIDYDHNRGKIDYDMIGYAIGNCKQIIDILNADLAMHPGSTEYQGALEVKQNELIWLEKDAKKQNMMTVDDTGTLSDKFATDQPETDLQAECSQDDDLEEEPEMSM